MGNDLSIPFIPLPISIAPEVYMVVSHLSQKRIYFAFMFVNCYVY